MYPEERRRDILTLINQQGRVAVSDLSQHYGVSEVTIRADLQTLADAGLVVRTHGGAIASGYGLYDLSLTKRLGQQMSQKLRIGEVGAAMVDDGDAIILDSSSTALIIAQNLKQRHDVTIITNSLAVAHEMLGVTGITLVMPGGTLHHDTASLVDNDSLTLLDTLNIQKGFFGAYGLSLSEGLTDVSAPEARFKRPLVTLCHKVIAVVDVTKWGRIGLASFAPLDEMDVIISDAGVPSDLLEQIRAMGIEVVLV